MRACSGWSVRRAMVTRTCLPFLIQNSIRQAGGVKVRCAYIPRVRPPTRKVSVNSPLIGRVNVGQFCLSSVISSLLRFVFFSPLFHDTFLSSLSTHRNRTNKQKD